jgi:hypothetical protein
LARKLAAPTLLFCCITECDDLDGVCEQPEH